MCWCAKVLVQFQLIIWDNRFTIPDCWSRYQQGKFLWPELPLSWVPRWPWWEELYPPPLAQEVPKCTEHSVGRCPTNLSIQKKLRYLVQFPDPPLQWLGDTVSVWIWGCRLAICSQTKRITLWRAHSEYTQYEERERELARLKVEPQLGDDLV